jgi:hypothetical protein
LIAPLKSLPFPAVMFAAVALSACASVPPSQRAAPRRDAYLRGHGELPPRIAEAIATGHLVVGMDREQVLAVAGQPVKSRTFKRDGRLTEVLIYPAFRLHQGHLRSDGGSLFRVVLVNGTVTYMEPF